MHRNFDRILLRYTAGDLSAAERQRFEAHLATCERCQQALSEWRAMANAVRDAAQDRAVSLPPLDFNRLELQPRGEKMNEIVISRPRTLPFAYSALVAVIALSFVAIFGAMLMRGGDPGGNGFGLAAVTETPTEFTVSSTMTPQSTYVSELPAGTRMGIPLADVPNGYGVVVVAMESIENGSVIDLRSIVLYALPSRFVPDAAPGHIEQVEGRIARTNIHCGQIITDGMLAMNARDVPLNMGEVGATLCASNWGMNPEMRHDTVFIMTEPVDTRDVVFFYQALPAGTILDEGMLRVEAYPVEIVPQIAIDREDAVGSVLTGDVAADSILVRSMVAGKVPEGKVAITIPFNHYFDPLDGLTVGDIVGVSGSILLPGYTGEGTAPQFGLDYVRGMEVVYVADMGVTVAGFRTNVARIHSMLDSGVQMNIVLEAEADAGLEGSRIEVSIPVIRIWGGSPLDIGQQVNVLSTLKYIDASVVGSEATAEVEPEHESYVAAGGALIVAVDDNTITLNILASDEAVLNWYVDSGAPMWFEVDS